MLITERNSLLNVSRGYKWREDFEGVKPVAGLNVAPVSSGVAEEGFLRAFDVLTRAGLPLSVDPAV